MNRKTFIYAISVLAIIPVLDFELKSYNGDPFTEIYTLNKFCSLKELKEIGKKYLELKPEENSKEDLIALLSPGKYNRDFIRNKNPLRKLIQNEIRNDFQNFNTFLLNGWVVSQTEARQCALILLT